MKIGTQTKETTRYWECQYYRLAALITLMDCARNTCAKASDNEKLETVNNCLSSCMEVIEAVNKGVDLKCKPQQ